MSNFGKKLILPGDIAIYQNRFYETNLTFLSKIVHFENFPKFLNTCTYIQTKTEIHTHIHLHLVANTHTHTHTHTHTLTYTQTQTRTQKHTDIKKMIY